MWNFLLWKFLSIIWFLRDSLQEQLVAVLFVSIM